MAETIDKKSVQITAAYALNLWTVSISQIIDYNDVNVLEQEYNTIMNNLDLEKMPHDEALLDIITAIMDEITHLRIDEGDKKLIERTYQRQLKNAVWSAVPNVGAIFATSNPIAMGVTLATQVGIGYMNYRRKKSEYESQNEKSKWEIQKNRMQHLNGLQRDLFKTAWRMTETYKFEDRYRLTEQQISAYNKALMNTNPAKRYNDLDVMRSNFEAYPAFWYQIGSTANTIYRDESDAELKEYYRKKAIVCFKRYDQLNKFNLLRHDTITAAWALEYLELQGLSDANGYDEAERLISIAEKHAGSSLDVIELCAFSYLRIRDYENATRLFHMLVNKDYNSEINTQLLSGLYIREMFSGVEDTKKKARLGYKQLPSIAPEQYILPMPSGGTDLSQWAPEWIKEELFDKSIEGLAEENQAKKKQLEEARKRAQPFYQNPILIVSDSDLDIEAEYFLGVLNENRNKINPALPAPSHTSMKSFRENCEEYERKGTHIIFLGKSREANTLFKAKNKKWDYDNAGLYYATLGNKTVIGTRSLKNKDLDRLIEMARNTESNHSIAAPDGVGTVHWSFLRDWFSDIWNESKPSAIICSIVLSPFLAAGEALIQTLNGVQAVSNLSAQKKMEYLQHCLAILEYLKSENALVE